MPLDQFGNYTGDMYGKDRLGVTTPDPEFSDPLRPWLPTAYPAPWLPARRIDSGHPVGASIVLTSGQLVGLDSSGLLIPAGLFSGPQGTAGISAVTVLEATTGGTAGSTSYTYSVVARNASGTTTPVSLTLTTGNATLSATNFVILNWDTVAGATSYDVLRVAGGTAASGTATALIGTSYASTFVDKGQTATSYVVPTTNTTSNPGQYCVIQYGHLDVKFTLNAATGNRVASPSEYVVLAAPANAANGDTVLGPYGNITITSDDITFANACTLIPAGTPHAIGYAIRNVYQFLGGVTVNDTTGGVNYTVEANIPTNFVVHNYMHEMATAIQTQNVLRMPWVGANEGTIDSLATADGVTIGGSAYVRSNIAKSWIHAVGAQGSTAGTFYPGCKVVPAAAGDSAGNTYAQGLWAAGCYAPYNPSVHTPDQIIGTCLAFDNMNPIKDKLDRVRTQWERGQSFLGPFAERNTSQLLMGGSATRGLDFALNLTGDSVFRAATDEGKTLHPEYSTYAIIRVLL